jgi:hypothetical protein
MRMSRRDELRASVSDAELAAAGAEWAEAQRAAAAAATAGAVEIYDRVCGRSSRVPSRPSAPVIPERPRRPHLVGVRPDSADRRTRGGKILEAMLAARGEDAPVIDRVSGRVLEAAMADVAAVPAEQRGVREKLRLSGLSAETVDAMVGPREAA